MKVLKFGGSSVGTVKSLSNVRQIAMSLAEPAVIVVSALGGITDKLIDTANGSADGEPFAPAVEYIRRRHYEIIDALTPEEQRSRVREEIDGMIDELARLLTGLSLINELPKSTLDRIVSFGERMSSVLVSSVIPGTAHRDSLEFIKTEKWHDSNIASRTATETLIREKIGLPLRNTVVTGGFIATDVKTGKITNLGRGGSDYTAALIAAALDAEVLEIWTDVNGFMTSDPRLIRNARNIPRMSFVESMELCSFGAKVIYPPTIYPVFHKNIPIKILNTLDPAAPGTLITENDGNLPDSVRGVSMVNDSAMIKLNMDGGHFDEDIAKRIKNRMSHSGIGVLMTGTPDNDGAYAVLVRGADSMNACDLLRNEFAPELGHGGDNRIETNEGLSTIAIVRENIRKLNGLGNRLCDSLEKAGIRIWGFSDNASEATMAIAVGQENAVKALSIVHDLVIPVE